MTQVEILELSGNEMLDTVFWFGGYSFHPSPPMRDKEEWVDSFLKRRFYTFYALRENGEPQSIAAYSKMTQNIRGVIYPTAGIWGVVTHPNARRKGYSRQVLAALFDRMRSDGMVFSALYPFRESFYERLGYITFPLPYKTQIKTQTLAPLLKMDLGGEVEIALFEDAYEAYWEFIQFYHRRVHGMALFDDGERMIAEENKDWIALAKIDGKVCGVMVYRLVGEEPTEFTLQARRFYYLNSQARYLLLDWIARHIDQADKVEFWLAPNEIPETWLADLNVHSESLIRAPMGRILDVSSIHGMEVGPGSFTVRLRDPLCPWNEGVWRFEGVDGKLQVSVGEGPECILNIQALTGLVCGTHDARDFVVRGWGNPSSENQMAMRNLFPANIPYMHSYF